MKKLGKALGHILVAVIYILVVIILIGIARWIWRACTHKAD